MRADALGQFCAAAQAEGVILRPEDVLADGVLHRCPVLGAKPGRKDGSYIFHPDGIPAGGFENHRNGQGWQNWRAEASGHLTPGELAQQRRRVEAARAARDLDRQARQEEAAARAVKLLATSRPADGTHPYLQAKGVAAYGIRRLRDLLVIPMRDADGRLWNLQFIGPGGGKRFLTGARKVGCYCPIGAPGEVLCISEGYATGASVFAATGHAVAVAFDAGNLKPVALALRAKFPDKRLVIAADDDRFTAGNPGLTAAIAAATAAGGLVAVPNFDDATP